MFKLVFILLLASGPYYKDFGPYASLEKCWSAYASFKIKTRIVLVGCEAVEKIDTRKK